MVGILGRAVRLFIRILDPNRLHPEALGHEQVLIAITTGPAVPSMLRTYLSGCGFCRSSWPETSTESKQCRTSCSRRTVSIHGFAMLEHNVVV